MRNRFRYAFLFLLIFSGSLLAGGFQINEHGSKAMAMGGAFTALANDPSSLYFNSAAITRLGGMQFQLGSTLISPSSSFRGISPAVDETKMVSQLFTPIHVYWTYQVTNDLYVGFGLNNPFGLGTKWDENWVGRFISVEADLKTFSFNPTVAYKVLDNLSVGVGLQYNIAMVLLTRKIGFTQTAKEATLEMEGSDNGAIGYTAGLLYEPFDNLALGFQLRSQVDYEFEGTAKTTGHPAALDSRVPKGNIKAVFSSPMQYTLGVAYKPMYGLTVTADYQSVAWSSYDYLKVDFDDAALTDISSPRLYEDTYILRFGAEYLYSKDLALRCGFLIDNTPVTDERVDPSLPDSDRLGFSAGVGYNLTRNMTLDLSYLFLRFAERTITNSDVSATTNGMVPFNGTYNSTANLFALSLSYNF